MQGQERVAAAYHGRLARIHVANDGDPELCWGHCTRVGPGPDHHICCSTLCTTTIINFMHQTARLSTDAYDLCGCKAAWDATGAFKALCLWWTVFCGLAKASVCTFVRGCLDTEAWIRGEQ